MTLFQVVVGSHLHGLVTPESDTDIRSVGLSDPLSPRSEDAPHTIETKEEEHVQYELRHFLRLCETNNATILEVLFSDQVQLLSTDFLLVFEHRMDFLDVELLTRQHLGYASNQVKTMQKRLDEALDADAHFSDIRTRKAMIAAIRMVRQGQLFLYAMLQNQPPTLKNANGQHRDLLMKIKTEEVTHKDYEEAFAVLEAERKMLVALEESEAIQGLRAKNRNLDQFTQYCRQIYFRHYARKATF